MNPELPVQGSCCKGVGVITCRVRVLEDLGLGWPSLVLFHGFFRRLIEEDPQSCKASGRAICQTCSREVRIAKI